MDGEKAEKKMTCLRVLVKKEYLHLIYFLTKIKNIA